MIGELSGSEVEVGICTPSRDKRDFAPRCGVSMSESALVAKSTSSNEEEKFELLVLSIYKYAHVRIKSGRHRLGISNAEYRCEVTKHVRILKKWPASLRGNEKQMKINYTNRDSKFSSKESFKLCGLLQRIQQKYHC